MERPKRRGRDQGFRRLEGLYEGFVSRLEDYAADELPLRPEEAQELGETATFHAVLENGLLRIETDEGSVLLHLRGEGGT